MAKIEVSARLLTDAGWRDLTPTEDAAEFIAQGRHRVWVDVCAEPHEAAGALESFASRCPQLAGVDPGLATKGGDYPPRYPPKAKAFGSTIFARAYWLGATRFSHEIRAQEVHILAGKSFAITVRYPPRAWDMRQLHGPQSDQPVEQDSLEIGEIERDVVNLRHRIGGNNRAQEDVAAGAIESFGLQVAIAVLDQVIDSVFESLNGIRLIADNLEAKVVEGTGISETTGGGQESVLDQTLDIRRLLRQVRWSFLPSDEISELRSGPFLHLGDPGIELQLDDLCREADRAVESVRDIIEQVQQVVELSNSLKTERLDQTIYALTVAATVLLVPTLLAGIWGMNFKHIPGTGPNNAFWVALLILAVMAAGAAIAISWYLRRTTTSSSRHRR